MRYNNIAFIVCSNGFGHLKRVLLVVRELYKLNPKLDVTIFCPESHLIIAKHEINFVGTKQIKYISDGTENEVSWLSPDRITVNNYEKWVLELSKYKDLEMTGLIVSDNHVAPLNVFKKAVLMGSFLWHDVVRFRNPDVDQLVVHEMNLLSNRNPNMLCLESMAMDTVKTHTDFIPLPWFCSKYSERFSVQRTKSILITGGGTGLINKKLAEICISILRKDSSIDIYVDSKIIELTKVVLGNKIKIFSFRDEDFSKLTAIVCRPGIGILTDCVRYSVPPISIIDGYNKEMTHNASRVVSLGIGYNIDLFDNETKTVSEKIIEIITNSFKINTCIEQLENQANQGAEVAARYLLKKLRSLNTV